VCVVGAGYVGSLTAITMAAQCPAVHFTVCDINQALVSKWHKDVLPFYEPQLGECSVCICVNSQPSESSLWSVKVVFEIFECEILLAESGSLLLLLRRQVREIILRPSLISTGK